jgi:tRNA threonylcarbamoyladenosine biosynthesis protein TsaB
VALILNIETSSRVCSVCLAGNGEALAHAEGLEGNEHAAKLTLFIDEVMHKAGMPYSLLDAVAVSAGPGSYTGLRIGTSVAKGLCYALDKPLIGVKTLMALANGIGEHARYSNDDVFMPILDAGRMDIYTALYNPAGAELRQTAMLTINAELETLMAAYRHIIVGGTAIKKMKELITGANFSYIENITCNARYMIKIAEQKYVEGSVESTAYFQPFYLNEFQPRQKNQSQKLLK